MINKNKWKILEKIINSLSSVKIKIKDKCVVFHDDVTLEVCSLTLTDGTIAKTADYLTLFCSYYSMATHTHGKLSGMICVV